MKRLIVLGALIIMGMVSPAFAVINPPVDCDGGTAQYTPCQAGGVPEVYQAINQVFINAGLASPGLASNTAADSLQAGANDYWSDLGGGTASSFAFVALTAANNNTFGLYPFGSPGTITYFPPSQTGFGYLGTGTVGDPYPGAVNPFPGGNFGFVLNSQNGSNHTWYSDPSLNSDGFDHLLAYYLPGLAGAQWNIDTNDDGIGDELITATSDTYLLAWEDLQNTDGSFDNDFNDTIFLVTRVTPVPEPMSMFLFGSGLAGLVGLRRKNS